MESEFDQMDKLKASVLQFWRTLSPDQRNESLAIWDKAKERHNVDLSWLTREGETNGNR